MKSTLRLSERPLREKCASLVVDEHHATRMTSMNTLDLSNEHRAH